MDYKEMGGRNMEHMTNIQYIILHHTGVKTIQMGEKEHFQSIQNALLAKYGKKFVLQYHHVVGHHGTVFKGQPVGQVCPHVGYDQDENNIHNWNALGVCCMGNFEEEFMKPTQFHTLVDLLRDLKTKYSIPNFRILPHNAIIPTLCPGKHFPTKELLQSINEKPWYDEAVQFCIQQGIMTGDEDGFRPDDPVLRAELASVLYRMHYQKETRR
jgi:N-acetylmuramoyl-L-alanine amidase